MLLTKEFKDFSVKEDEFYKKLCKVDICWIIEQYIITKKIMLLTEEFIDFSAKEGLDLKVLTSVTCF
jgi:hypothetical protein